MLMVELDGRGSDINHGSGLGGVEGAGAGRRRRNLLPMRSHKYDKSTTTNRAVKKYC